MKTGIDSFEWAVGQGAVPWWAPPSSERAEVIVLLLVVNATHLFFSLFIPFRSTAALVHLSSCGYFFSHLYCSRSSSPSLPPSTSLVSCLFVTNWALVWFEQNNNNINKHLWEGKLARRVPHPHTYLFMLVMSASLFNGHVIHFLPSHFFADVY